MKLITPYLFMVVVTVGVVMLGRDIPSNRGYFYLSLMASLSYGGLVLNLIWLHRMDMLKAGERILLRQWWPQVGAGLATVGLLVLGVGFRGDEALTGVFDYQRLHFSGNVLAQINWRSKSPSNSGVVLSSSDKIESIKKYVIKPGDNLWKISLKEYGDGQCWPELQMANSGVIRSARELETGTELIIPILTPEAIIACR